MSSVDAEIAVAEYQAFLAIAVSSPGLMVAPTSLPCDEAWHAHILHTQAYARDMRAIFGGPFHHRPGESADDPTLAEPQRRTTTMLHSLRNLGRWPGLADARKARGIPPELPLTTAAMLGMLIAEGPMDFELVANRYRRPGGGPSGSGGDVIILSSDGGAGCSSGGAPDSSSSGGDSGCNGSSCNGSSCSGSSCGGSSV
jgi:hypothetical protein